jgi:hypothetical protein
MEECNYDYAEAQKRVEEYCRVKREEIAESDKSEEIKSAALAELDKIEEESKDLETLKIALEEAQPKRHFSTNLVPFGVRFRLTKSGTMYIRTKQGVRRVDAEGNIISRNRRARGNATKSLARTKRSKVVE